MGTSKITNKRRTCVPRRRLSGMTLIETMAAVAIVGLLAALAVPAVGDLSAGYRAKSAAMEVLSAVRAGRDYSQKLNAVIQVRWDGSAVVLDAQDIDEVANSEALVKVVNNGNWIEIRRYPVSSVVSMVTFPTQIYFCPTSEGRYRMGTADGTATCAIGNIAQIAPSNTGTADAKITFKALGKTYSITVASAVGTAKIKSGT